MMRRGGARHRHHHHHHPLDDEDEEFDSIGSSDNEEHSQGEAFLELDPNNQDG